MPSKTSFPMNLTRTNNNVSDSRTGANWKDISGKTPSPANNRGGNPTAKIVTVGLYRPDHNKQYTLGYYGADKPENTNDANAFRARPLKHYRKQYGNNNNKQTNYRGNLITDVFETPGGNIVKNYSDVNCDDTNAPGVLLVPNYSLKEINQFNKVGKSGNSTTVTFDATNTNQTKEFYNFKSLLFLILFVSFNFTYYSVSTLINIFSLPTTPVFDNIQNERIVAQKVQENLIPKVLPNSKKLKIFSLAFSK